MSECVQSAQKKEMGGKWDLVGTENGPTWRLYMPRSRITEAGYCHGVKKIITRLIFNQSFQTISEFLAEIPVKKMRYWSLNLIILKGDGSVNNVHKPWKMAIFWVPLEIGCSKLGEFLLKETTYVIVPYIFFFNV